MKFLCELRFAYRYLLTTQSPDLVATYAAWASLLLMLSSSWSWLSGVFVVWIFGVAIPRFICDQGRLTKARPGATEEKKPQVKVAVAGQSG